MYHLKKYIKIITAAFSVAVMIYSCTPSDKKRVEETPAPPVVEKPHIPKKTKLRILFAGDLMQHETQLKAARREDGTYSYTPCYHYIKNEVSSADIAVANLEVMLGGKRYRGYPMFCAPDSFLYAAKNAGFDLYLLANNHVMDCGKGGALRTLNLLDSLGLMHCGLYRDSIDRAARYPLMIEQGGERIAMLNYTYGTNGLNVPSPLIVNLIDKNVISKDVERAKELGAETIIACMHWGSEYVSLPPREVKDMANWLLKQGVTHVIGGHPHVLQPMELREDTVSGRRNAVVYSLGNLISAMYDRRRDGGAMVNLTLSKIDEQPKPAQLDYILTWVARPHRDGFDNFVILPAATPPDSISDTARSKIAEFLSDSRTLFEKYNAGDVNETEAK